VKGVTGALKFKVLFIPEVNHIDNVKVLQLCYAICSIYHHFNPSHTEALLELKLKKQITLKLNIYQ